MDETVKDEGFDDALRCALEDLGSEEDDAVDELMLEGLRSRMGLAQTPLRVDRFTLLEQVGSGGMGVVYAAHDPRLDRRVALKLLRRSGLGGAEQGLREARALARLSHPNVVTVFEAGLHEGQVFVAMELVEGRTLRQWLEQRRPWREICEVLVAAGRGLAAAHAAGIVHRDFKPGNVLLGERTQVADFGLALADVPKTSTDQGDAPASEYRTSPLRRPGTLAYMAPEQLRGAPADAKTDQFALCVVLYEALAGTHPFGGKTPEERLASITEAGPSGDLDGGPRWLRALVLKGLDPRPEHRHPTLDSLLDTIDRHLQPRSRAGWLVAVLAGITAIVALLGSNEHDSPCRDAAAPLDEVWNAERRTLIATAFDATATPYAEHARDFVGRSVDRYAARWAQSRVDACQLQRKGETSTLTLECLDRRALELDALLEQLETADARLVKRASEAVSRLQPVEHCDDPDPGLDRSNLSPEELERLRSAEEQIARSWALDLVGGYAQGLEMVDAAVPPLRDLGHEGTLSVALMHRGRLKVRVGDHESSYDDLHEAVERGLVGRSDYTVALAAAALAEELGKQEQFVRAHEAADLAAAMHRRLTGEPEWPLLSNTIGMLLSQEVRNVESVEAFARGIAACDPEDHRDWPDLISLYGNQSMALLRLGRLDEAERALEGALEIGEKLVGLQHPQMAILMISGAALQSERKNPERALEIQREAREIWRRSVPGPSSVTASMTYNLGLFLLELERHDEALEAMLQATAVWDEVLPKGHSRRAMGHSGIGMVRLAMGDAQAALQEHERTLALLDEEIRARRPSAGFALLNATRAALALEDTERAEAWISAGQEIYANDPNPPMEGSFLFEHARLTELTGDTEGAKAQARKALERLTGHDPKTEDEVRAWLRERDG